MNRNRHGEAGFTLVEAMVSLFVFALLSAGCVAMLTQSVTAQNRIGQAEEAIRELQAARALLAADLAQVATGGVGFDGATPMAFDGQGAGVEANRHVRFVRGAGDPDPAAPFATSLVSVEYLIEGSGQLVRRVRPFGGDATQFSDRLLLKSGSNIRFEFADGVTWRDDWRTPNGSPPRAVAIVASVPRYDDFRISAYVGLS